MDIKTDNHMDVWTDIRTDANCTVIKNFCDKTFFSNTISGYPVGYTVIYRMAGQKSIRSNHNMKEMVVGK